MSDSEMSTSAAGQGPISIEVEIHDDPAAFLKAVPSKTPPEAQRMILVVSPQERAVRIEWLPDDLPDAEKPSEVQRGLVYWLPVYPIADARNFLDWLEERRDQFRVICDGHSVDRGDSGYHGRLTKEAQDAFEELRNLDRSSDADPQIDDYVPRWGGPLEEAHEWLAGLDSEELMEIKREAADALREGNLKTLATGCQERAYRNPFIATKLVNTIEVLRQLGAECAFEEKAREVQSRDSREAAGERNEARAIGELMGIMLQLPAGDVLEVRRAGDAGGFVAAAVQERLSRYRGAKEVVFSSSGWTQSEVLAVMEAVAGRVRPEHTAGYSYDTRSSEIARYMQKTCKEETTHEAERIAANWAVTRGRWEEMTEKVIQNLDLGRAVEELSMQFSSEHRREQQLARAHDEARQGVQRRQHRKESRYVGVF